MQLITEGQIVTVYYEPFFFIGNDFIFGIPVSLYISSPPWPSRSCCRSAAHSTRLVHRVGRYQPGGLALLRHQRARPGVLGLHAFCAVTAGIAALIITSNVQKRRRQ